MTVETVAANVVVLGSAVAFFVGGIKSIHSNSVEVPLVLGIVGMTAIFVFDYFYPGVTQAMLGVSHGSAVASATGSVSTMIAAVAVLFLSFLQRSSRL